MTLVGMASTQFIHNSAAVPSTSLHATPNCPKHQSLVRSTAGGDCAGHLALDFFDLETRAAWLRARDTFSPLSLALEDWLYGMNVIAMC